MAGDRAALAADLREMAGVVDELFLTVLTVLEVAADLHDRAVASAARRAAALGQADLHGRLTELASVRSQRTELMAQVAEVADDRAAQAAEERIALHNRAAEIHAGLAAETAPDLADQLAGLGCCWAALDEWETLMGELNHTRIGLNDAATAAEEGQGDDLDDLHNELAWAARTAADSTLTRLLQAVRALALDGMQYRIERTG